ncbi:MAG: glutamine-hydrolyzing GMP synthase [Anaerolineales bacterium]|jgi:GMP synthase (glutamine-hydrolysing)
MDFKSVAVLDFGSQTSQLIVRRIREGQIFCQLFPWDAPAENVLGTRPGGFVLSGGPASVYQIDAPSIPEYVFESKLPILGICYGMQALTHTLGGIVAPAVAHEYGSARFNTIRDNPLLPSESFKVWMSHGDRIKFPPTGFEIVGSSPNSPIAAIADLERSYFGVQFHPEVQHTPRGAEILRNFAIQICGVKPEWTPDSMTELAIQNVRRQVGSNMVLSAVSGGVDSSVATALVGRAVGEQLAAVFVDTGMLRKGEAAKVKNSLQEHLGVELVLVDAGDIFLSALEGVTDPEQKRQVIGECFIRIFEEQARSLGSPAYLVQGTIYPDVVESSAADRSKAQRIKSHHNVGGLPPDMEFKLVEPLRYLFKDEVRLVGEYLGLPGEIVWRQPFPGPGLAVRCLGGITQERLDRLRAADEILLEELAQGGYFQQSRNEKNKVSIAQAFMVLLPVRSVGVMGDQRTFQETAAVRAVTTSDFMTADWARLPHSLLERISSRIVNEVEGINRVVYDITSKPPATIEWE